MTQEMAKVKAVKFHNYKVELSENRNGMPVARLFKFITVGKNKGTYKSIEGFYFATEDKRTAWIKEKVKSISANIKGEAERREKNKLAAGSHPFKVGDALYASWGYDQTNIDFFEVVGIGAKSVKVRAIGQNYVTGSEGFMCENVTPAMGSYLGEAQTRIVKAYTNGENANYYVSNGRHSLSLYTSGDKGLYQSHYA